jgi:hypothetical protein
MLKRIKLIALVMYAIVLISVSLGLCQSAEEMIKNPSLKPKSSALKYVFQASDRISFTMYIRGDEITIIHSNTGHMV